MCSAFARRYDDYDYGEVNQLLARDLKLYIKAVACYPDATKTLVCPLSWTLLKASERVRVFLTDLLEIIIKYLLDCWHES